MTINKIVHKNKHVKKVFLAILLTTAGIYFFGGKVVLAADGLDPRMSVSHDGQHITFSYRQADNFAIFIAKSDGTEIKQLTFPQADYHIGPAFSSDDSKILFLSYPKMAAKPHSYIYIMDVDGDNLKQVTSKDENITEAVFSADDKIIYFVISNYFGHYSPAYRSRPHEEDIFSISVDGRDLKQLTNFNAYGLTNLQSSPDGKELYFIDEGTSTFCGLSIRNPSQKKVILSGQKSSTFLSFLSLDDKLRSNYTFSPNKKYIVFTDVSEKKRRSSPYEYELFLMDMGTKHIKQLTALESALFNPKFVDHQKVLFINNTNWKKTYFDDTRKTPPRYELMSVDLTGTHLERINLASISVLKEKLNPHER